MNTIFQRLARCSLETKAALRSTWIGSIMPTVSRAMLPGSRTWMKTPILLVKYILYFKYVYPPLLIIFKKKYNGATLTSYFDFIFSWHFQTLSGFALMFCDAQAMHRAKACIILSFRTHYRKLKIQNWCHIIRIFVCCVEYIY